MRYLRIFVLSLLLIIVGYVYLFLKVSQIECVTLYGPCDQDLQNSLDFLFNQRIFSDFQKQDITSRIASNRPIEKVNITRRLPQKLFVEVVYRIPVVRVSSGQANQNLAVDTQGVVMNINSPSNLPYLATQKQYSNLDQLDDDTLKAVNLLLIFVSKFGNSSQAEFQSPIIKIQQNNTQILLDINYISSDWPDVLQKIFQSGRINHKTPKIVDLRFSQPVLTY